MMQKSEKKSAVLLTKGNDYEKHLNLSTQWNRWTLSPLGIWPNSLDDTRIGKYICRLANIVCYFLICFLLIPTAAFMIYEVEELYNKIRLFGPSSFCVMAIFKYYFLHLRKSEIRDCLKRIERDWRNVSCMEDRSIMIEKANSGRRLSAISAFFMYSTFLFYYIALPIKAGTMTIDEQNVTYIPMVFPFSRYIVDTRYSPINEIFFFGQILAGVVIHSVTAGACSLAAVFATHACGQMEILNTWLKHLVDGRPDMCKYVDGRIGAVVNQHIRVLTFLTLVETTLRQVSFVEFLGCTLNLCLLGYYVITEWDSNDLTSTITYLMLLTSLTFNIFIFCYIGELVSEYCKKVAEASYMIEWYRLTGKRKLCLILIISMSNSSIKLTAGNIINLSIGAFGDVIKTAFTYMNMLRTVT